MGRNHDADKELWRKRSEEIEALEANLNGPGDLANVIDKYRESIADGTWEFMGSYDFVAAQAVAARGFREFCESRGIPCPEPPTWPAIGKAFRGAMWIS